MRRSREAVLDMFDTLGIGTNDHTEVACMSRRAIRRERKRSRRSDERHGDPDNAASHDDRFDSRDPHDEVDEALLSNDERAYRKARRAAEAKAEIYLDAGKSGLVVLLLLFFVFPVGFVAFIWWMFAHGRGLFRVMVEPGLRERLVEEEVGRQVESNVVRERRELADEHSHSLEVLSASIAHEIRNPITAAKSLLQQMSELPEAPDNREYAQVALGELERVERSISHLLRFGREEEMRAASIRMRDVLDSALETFRERAEREGVSIEREYDCEGELRGDAEQLRRVVINLVGNAMDALLDAGVEVPRILVSMGENLAGSQVWVRIRDNGLGIEEGAEDELFKPFYTEKHGGTGLGLAITKKLVDAHSGQIEVVSNRGAGAEFVLSFPKDGGPMGGPNRRGASA
jgi:signal transduction histidine kinase